MCMKNRLLSLRSVRPISPQWWHHQSSHQRAKTNRRKVHIDTQSFVACLFLRAGAQNADQKWHVYSKQRIMYICHHQLSQLMNHRVHFLSPNMLTCPYTISPKWVLTHQSPSLWWGQGVNSKSCNVWSKNNGVLVLMMHWLVCFDEKAV